MSSRRQRSAKPAATAAEIVARRIGIGTCVELASGGAQMTVERIVDGVALCVWHDKVHKLREREFPLTSLVPAPVNHDGELLIIGLNATADEARARLKGFGNA